MIRNVIAEQRIVESFLKDTQYNSLHRPTSDGGEKFSEDGATQVKLFSRHTFRFIALVSHQVECSLFVRAFGALDMVSMDYSVDITLRQRWRDPRLMFKGQVRTQEQTLVILRQKRYCQAHAGCDLCDCA